MAKRGQVEFPETCKLKMTKFATVLLMKILASTPYEEKTVSSVSKGECSLPRSVLCHSHISHVPGLSCAKHFASILQASSRLSHRMHTLLCNALGD